MHLLSVAKFFHRASTETPELCLTRNYNDLSGFLKDNAFATTDTLRDGKWCQRHVKQEQAHRFLDALATGGDDYLILTTATPQATRITLDKSVSHLAHTLIVRKDLIKKPPTVMFRLTGGVSITVRYEHPSHKTGSRRLKKVLKGYQKQDALDQIEAANLTFG